MINTLITTYIAELKVAVNRIELLPILHCRRCTKKKFCEICSEKILDLNKGIECWCRRIREEFEN